MKKSIMTLSFVVLMVVANAGLALSDPCDVILAVSGATVNPCEPRRVNLPVYIVNPCSVGGFTIDIAVPDSGWIAFNPDDTLAADTIGSRISDWDYFHFSVFDHSPGHIRVMGVANLDSVPNYLPPGNGLLCTLHLDFNNYFVTDTCQMLNFERGNVSDPTGYILYNDTLEENQLCIRACPCEGIRGDANCSAALNGLDVIFLVAYFRGGPSYCGLCGGDANNSGNVNGIDVTFLVNYFKGGPGPVGCQY